MRNLIIVLVMLFSLSFSYAQNNAPEVTNVTFSQRTDGSFIVDVYYDLNDADSDTMFVTMQVSQDRGATWNFACDSISGDVGVDILSDTSKHVVWDFGAEHPQTFGDGFRIAIIANDSGFESGIVSDIDGYIYKTVKIGNQWWMAENLKTIHYSNGDPIPHVILDPLWRFATSGAYCNYDNDTTLVATYGRLYNWYAVDDSLNIAPSGWHVPTDGEWQTLIDYLGGGVVAGGKMKSTGTISGGNGLWQTPNLGATNESGFSALPGGFRNHSNGRFYSIGDNAHFWSSTAAFNPYVWSRYLVFDSSGVIWFDCEKQKGFSVRCVRD